MEREISIILKVRGAKAAKKSVNDIFNKQTQTLVDGYTKSTKKAGDATDRLGKKSKTTSKSLGSFTKTLGRGMAALYLYNRAWQTFGRNFESGLQLQRASNQFERHVGNVTKMLPALKAATRGVIADFDLLKTANRAFQQGIQPQQMASTFGMATSAAQKLGLSATDAIKTITDAITTQNEGALKTLGVITNVNQAYQTQAALIAKNGGVMSKAMSIQLRQSLIMKELQNRFGGANKVQADGLMILERFKASWKNFRAVIGQTLGIALIPLTRALTGVLDVTTALLDRLNKTEGFKKFTQVALTLAGVFAGAKFAMGVGSLVNLLGMFRTGAIASSISKTAPALKKFKSGLLGLFMSFKVSSVKDVFKVIAAGTGGILKTGAKLLKWGAAFNALAIFIEPVGRAFAKAWQMGKVFFQLISNYDSETGLSRVLKEDAKSVGKLYNFTETLAKGFLKLIAIAKGVAAGMDSIFRPLIRAMDWGTSRVFGFAESLGILDKQANIASGGLETLEYRFMKLTKYLGSAYLGGKGGAMLGSMFGPVGTVAGGVLGAGAGLGYAALTEGDASVSAPRPQGRGRDMSSPFPFPQTQESTRRESPSPKPINLDYADDNREINKKTLKAIEKQNAMMEEDRQRQEIRESQKNARGNIMFRR